MQNRVHLDCELPGAAFRVRFPCELPGSADYRGECASEQARLRLTAPRQQSAKMTIATTKRPPGMHGETAHWSSKASYDVGQDTRQLGGWPTKGTCDDPGRAYRT